MGTFILRASCAIMEMQPFFNVNWDRKEVLHVDEVWHQRQGGNRRHISVQSAVGTTGIVNEAMQVGV